MLIGKYKQSYDKDSGGNDDKDFECDKCFLFKKDVYTFLSFNF